MSVSLCLKKARQSHHQRASKRSGSVGNRGELAPLNQARGAQSTKSCLGGTELCKAQNCSKHKIVQSTKLCKTQNCAKHKIVQRTKFCKAQICAKHKLVQSTKLCKEQNCSKRACNTWTLVVCRLELFLLCNLKRLCNSSRLRGSFAMDPLLEVQFSENSGGSSGGINVQCRRSGGCFDARSCHKHSLSQPSPYHLLTPIFTYTSTLDTLLTQIYLQLLSLDHSIQT